MSSFLRLLFTSIILFLILGTAEDEKDRSAVRNLADASSPAHSGYFILREEAILYAANGILSACPSGNSPYVRVNHQASRRSARRSSVRFKEAVSGFLEIKPDIILDKGYSIRRIPLKEPEVPPTC